MKNKLVYLFIISMVVVSSCKKEEEKPYSGGLQGGIVTAYIRGYVKDSATNLPLQGAIINNSSISTNVYGRYVCAITYNNNPKYCPPYTAIEAITNNKIGWINLATYYLIPNDTITAPNIYVIPASFAKLHVKDTTMTAAASVHLSCSYEYYYGTVASFTDTIGHYTDTTFFQPIRPSTITNLEWDFRRGSFYPYHNLYFTLPAGDTIAENIFY